MKRRTDRQVKRQIMKLFKKLKTNSYFEDCNYQPCRVESKGYYNNKRDGEINGIRLIDGNQSSCSLRYCGPHPITKKDALERLLCLQTQSYKEYLKKFIFSTITIQDETWLDQISENVEIDFAILDRNIQQLKRELND